MVKGKYLTRVFLLIFSLIALLQPFDVYAQSDIGTFKYSKQITDLQVYTGNLTKKTNSFYQVNGPAYAPSFITDSSFNYDEGDIFTFSYYILDFAEYSYLNGSNTPPSCLGSGYWLTILNCDMNMGMVSEIDNQNSTLSISGSELGSYNSSTGTININNSRYYVDSFNIQYKPQHFYYFSYIVKANHSRTGATSLDFQNNIVNLNHATDNLSFIMPSRNFQVFSGTSNIDDLIQYLEDHPDSAGEQMEQDKQEQQQQGEQSQDNSNQSGTDVSQNTTSILNAITGFFSAFTSATPTNCNMDWGLASYGFGVINMCQNPIPQEFQVILSIISLLIVIPMILWLFSSIINAFKEFQS